MIRRNLLLGLLGLFGLTAGAPAVEVVAKAVSADGEPMRSFTTTGPFYLSHGVSVTSVTLPDDPGDSVRDPITTEADCAHDWRIEVLARADCWFDDADELTGAMVTSRSKTNTQWVGVTHDPSIRVPKWWNGIHQAKSLLEKLDAAGVEWRRKAA